MPEMLWAGLLFTSLPRERVFYKIRELADYVGQFRDLEDAPTNVTLSGLSVLPDEKQSAILKLLTEPKMFGQALAPLLLFDALPAKNIWGKFLPSPSQDWHPLMVAVAKQLDHQSETSTDCRWINILCLLTAGKLSFSKGMEELVKEIIYYPDYGEMNRVRPMIRAAEGGMVSLLDPKTSWPEDFWKECLEKTHCFPLGRSDHKFFEQATTIDQVRIVYSQLVAHCLKTRATTSIDAKHETVFGTGLYSLTLLLELLRINASQTISAQLALRTLVECYINLAYLTKKDDGALWKSYRVYGAGQAKLAYLKLESSDDSPSYVDTDTLEQLANEDLWQEYLPIELGHWDKTNLRKSSEDAGVKDVYDRYYSWTSSYLHGHWGTIRDTVYETCGNPLHRLHRIPAIQARLLPDVLPDACIVVDLLLQVISICYPTFSPRVTIEDISYDASIE